MYGQIRVHSCHITIYDRMTGYELQTVAFGFNFAPIWSSNERSILNGLPRDYLVDANVLILYDFSCSKKIVFCNVYPLKIKSGYTKWKV